MNKYDLDATDFVEKFSHIRKKSIALYGAGRLTKNLLLRLTGFNIVCIIDKDTSKVGTLICGIPVVSLDSYSLNVDCIIINTSELYWNEIYDTLIGLKLPIYYRDGVLANRNNSLKSILQEYKKVFNAYKADRIIYLIEKQLSNKDLYNIPTEIWGYCIYGPVVYTFFDWLCKNAFDDGLEQYLFLARDGYLLSQEYSVYLEKRGLDDDGIVYFPASRRLTCVSAIDSEESFDRVASYPFQGPFSDYLKNRFNVSPVDLKNDSEVIVLPNDWSKVKEVLFDYKNLICSEIKEEKAEYLQYISSLHIKRRVGIIDFGFYGTLSFYLSKLLCDSELSTYYFNGDIASDNPYYDDSIKVCYQQLTDKYAMRSCFRRYQNQNEAVFTAPYGMMERIVNQTIIYQQERTKRSFVINTEIDNGIKKFISDMNGLVFDCTEELRMSVDRLFGELNKLLRLQNMQSLHYIDTWSGL